MSDMRFGLLIEAKDQTKSAIGSALAGYHAFVSTVSKPITIPLKIASGTLGFLRDINLGLRPLLHDVDSLIEKGTASGAIAKSFESLTGMGAAKAEKMGNFLKQAAHGSLQLDTAMQLANRAMAAGLDVVRDLPVIFDFASRKAASMGADVEVLLRTMFAGAARGETSRIFEPLGILQKGLEGIKKDYELIAGTGAWDKLTPAARDAEMIRQAIREMQQQMGRLGISGRETVFQWRGLKNEIKDTANQLVEAIAQSGLLHDVVKGTRELVSGLTRHFREGGSIQDVLFGKKGGESGGLVGGLKELVKGGGELLGEGLKKAFGSFDDMIDSAWDRLQPKLDKEWETLKKKIIEGLTEGTAPLVSAIESLKTGPLGRLFGSGGGAPTPLAARAASSQPSDSGQLSAAWQAGKAAAPGVVAREAAAGLGARGVQGLTGAVAKQLAEEQAASAAMRFTPLMGDVASAGAARPGLFGTAARGAVGFLAKRAVPLVTVADFLYSSYKFGKGLSGYLRARDEQNLAEEDLDRTKGMARDRQGRGEPGPPPPWVGMGGLAPALAASAIGSTPGSGGEEEDSYWAKLLRDFPPEAQISKDDVAMPVDPSRFALTRRGREMRQAEMKRIDYELNQIDRGNRFVRQDALKKVGKEARRLRQAGWAVSPADEREMLAAEMTQLAGEKMSHIDPKKWGGKSLMERRQDLSQELAGSAAKQEQQGNRDAMLKLTEEFLKITNQMNSGFKEFIAFATGVLGAIAADERELATIQ